MARRSAMENMEISNQFNNIYAGKKVLLTGHTGFKGAWLALWLEQLGAEIIGYALDPPTSPNLFSLLNIKLTDYRHNLLEKETLKDVVEKHQPDIIFHLAAQPLVRTSYTEPEDTFLSNAIGTMNLLEACRTLNKKVSIVCITTDKVYHNNEWVYGYREVDALGGYDPYSASKACAEIIINAYRKSFFNPEKDGAVQLASARAGNVIGGGDWAAYRIVPDFIQALAGNQKLIIRSPRSVRPWQHVLEPLSGYLYLGMKLLQGEKQCCDAWNFGPDDENIVDVKTLVEKALTFWPGGSYEIQEDKNAPHEAGLLKLDCSKAKHVLKWFPVLDFTQTMALTVNWYRDYSNNSSDIRNRTLADLNVYTNTAKNRQANWIS
ncbi:MAG: CDP-glucose 4,6-dehydratase [Chitinophagales bacterium]|nr:CDP-glucose 4,6-dehydratase [Chitinophagales bacterium]